MAEKISKISKSKALNCKIHPVLYDFYLRLKDTLGAEIVHRRKRASSTCIEIIFYSNFFVTLSKRMNTLKEAESCGFWVICRAQTKPNKMFYREHHVHQLFLSPVHPKKRREINPVITSLADSDSAFTGAATA